MQNQEATLEFFQMFFCSEAPPDPIAKEDGKSSDTVSALPRVTPCIRGASGTASDSFEKESSCAGRTRPTRPWADGPHKETTAARRVKRKKEKERKSSGIRISLDPHGGWP